MKKSKSIIIKSLLEENIPNLTKAGFRRAKKAYNTLSRQNKAKVGQD